MDGILQAAHHYYRKKGLAQITIPQAFMRSKIENTFNTLGMDNCAATHLETLLRSEVVNSACEYGIQNCIDESLRLFRQWMSNDFVNPINPDLKSTVYCSAIRHGGVEEWDFAFKQYKTATIAAETLLLLTTMGCSREPWVISRYLERALTAGEIRKQDALEVFVYVSNNPIGHSLAWNYFRQRWDYIIAEYGSSFFACIQVIEELTSPFNTQFELNQLKYFMETHPNQGTGTRAFQQAVEKTQGNIKWMENNLETVKSWLINLGYMQ